MLRIKKRTSAPPIVTFERSDGTVSTTTLKQHFFLQHDLTHYAVETVLKMQSGFFGLVESGRELGSMESEEWQGEQGTQSEAIVMAIQSLRSGVAQRATIIDFIGMSCQGTGVSVPENLDEVAIDAILSTLDNVLSRWLATEPGSELVLAFPTWEGEP